MDTLLNDLRYSLRQLLKARSGAAMTILTLALGISANTAMFTLVNATLFRPAAAIEPDRLAWISSGDKQRAVSYLSYLQYRALKEQMRTASGVLAYGSTNISLGGKTPERLRALVVSGNYFEVLGTRAVLGRTFAAEEDSIPGAHPVVVLSHALWSRRFASDPHIVDSTIILNGQRFNVIGVAPPEFGGVDFDDPTEVWAPLAMMAQIMPTQTSLLTEVRSGWLRVVARLAPNSTMGQTNAELQSLVQQFNTQRGAGEREIVFAATRLVGGLDPSNRREIAPIMGLLSLVPFLVLLVACANAANMQLAKGVARRREFAVRRAIGATRSRIVRQLLTESVVLSMLAGVLGVLMSFWLLSLILKVGDAPVFLSTLLTPDPRVLIATTVLAMVTGIVFGLAPALAATSPAMTSALKDEGVTFVLGRTRHRLRSILVVGQVTVSLVLVVTAGLFVRSLDKALRVDPGFEPSNAVTASFDLGMQGYSEAARSQFESNLLERAQAMPGTTGVALAGVLPLSGRAWGTEVQTESARTDQRGESVGMSSVSPGYFGTMGIPLVRGRDFSTRDNSTTAKVVIIDELLAKRLWPNADPIGKRLRIASSTEPLREVVGVARNGHYASLIENPRGFFYVPRTQYAGFESSVSIVLRTTGTSHQAIAPLTGLFTELDPNLPLYKVQTLEQSIAQVVDKQRAAAALLGVFGLMALVLAALGLYGVTAHGVRLRTREIGIRVSLGAQTIDVLTLFVREGVKLALFGVAIGLVGSAALSRTLEGFLFGLAATDSLTFLSGALVLCLVAALASYVPARRAAMVDPLVALRAD